MDFSNKKLEEYVTNHTSEESEVLYELNRKTNLNVLRPRMLSGHVQGRFLSMVSQMIQPKNILEIGTYTGYSALCLAEGLQKNGKLITIDKNEELEEMVRDYISKANMDDKIQLIIGDATQIIPTLTKSFDLVFIDADKTNYLVYYDLLIDQLPTGAFLLADNILWSGKVIEPVKKNDKDTAAILTFNKKIHEDPRVENVLLPIRDGLLLIRKK